MTPGGSASPRDTEPAEHPEPVGDRESSYLEWEDPAESPSTPPPAQALAWVERVLGDPVTAVEPLPGGVSSSIHRLTIGSVAAAKHRVVLRRYTLADWLTREPYIPHDEARTLSLLGRMDVGVPTPTLVAADPDGVHCDAPAILMTEVGGAPDIDPAEPAAWATALAECLAGIHRVPVPEGLGHYRRWDRHGGPIPSWTARPDLWREAAARVAGPLPRHRPTFIHRDFHPSNVHWEGGRICAVVDWLGACVGPAAADLAHCRWNLAILAEPWVAGVFTEHYRALTGHDEGLTEYDLATILSGPVGPFPTFAWNALGRHDLTSDTVAPRIDRWLAIVLGHSDDRPDTR